ncbi:cell wall hydrolase [Palleronia abyssalis]|uniref:Cell wall hydrolase SleB domain-containing protein n=1 Tax=Palleronia abyssalis TaxID=1501240 RepID=A0A2R8C028_9RHOB|nr:cell wall hydrolase [Palleronia abyssalis]SPJ25750.1 hypothetical protein PAA8504_03601 [Palleronia abyssalis]
MQSDTFALRVFRRATMILGLLMALSVISTGNAQAEIRFSTKSSPTMDLSGGLAVEPTLGTRLQGLLGTSAPEVRPQRGAGLNRVFGSKTRAAVFKIDHTYDFVDTLPAASGDAQFECLVEALYFEARGESAEGVFAVAEVILNRVDSDRFPSSICKVVNQGTGKKYACQFSYTCDGIPDRIRETGAHERMKKIARLMIDEGPRDLTEGALFYHTKAVNPSWSRVFARTTTIGAHHFYNYG